MSRREQIRFLKRKEESGRCDTTTKKTYFKVSSTFGQFNVRAGFVSLQEHDVLIRVGSKTGAANQQKQFKVSSMLIHGSKSFL